MDSLYKTNPDYVARTVSGLTVIVPVSENCPKFNGMMKLNHVGLFLWNLFSEGCCVSRACDAIIEKYEVSQETALKDIKEFICNLEQHNLVFKCKDNYAD
jgi:hypothetical protein